MRSRWRRMSEQADPGLGKSVFGHIIGVRRAP
jgi:hypothetical protein